MKLKLLVVVLIALVSNQAISQIPILNSNLAATGKVIYLDFDGENVSGTLWNSSFSTPTITAVASTLSSASIIIAWKRMSEDYIPFNVNVTTDLTKFFAAPIANRIRVVITPSSAWYPASAGGVAYLNSFLFSTDTPVWVFENKLSYNPRYVAEAGSHEVGHSLSLSHQSTYDGSCVKTNEYNPGLGAGVTSWAPIMGVGYYNNVTIWHKGTNSNGCAIIQSDHSPASITNPTRLSFKTDDVGNDYATAKELFLNTAIVKDSGLISEAADIDAYKFKICNTRRLTFNIKPWALDTINYSGANLDIKFQLFNAASSSLILDAPISKLSSLTTMTLVAGSYYFTIDGDGSANYTDYASLGRYYATIYSTNVPAVLPTFTVSPLACAGNISFTDASIGLPNTWLWSVSGPMTFTSSVQNPNFAITSAGLYTVNLMASNSSTSLGCPSTSTMMINPSPNITVNSGSICKGSSFTLTPSGAVSYTYTGGLSIVSPTSTTSYSVIGTGSNGCVSYSPSISSVVVYTLPIISVNSGSICNGKSFTMLPSGAVTYTYSSGLSVVSPTALTSYTVFGTDMNGCNSIVPAISTISVIASPIISVNSGSICMGSSFTITPSGAISYTYSGGSAIVFPAINSSYTVTGSSLNGCESSNLAISNVTVNPNPNINITTTEIIMCEGNTATLTASGGNTYVWNTTETTPAIVISPTVTTSYTTTGTDLVGCKNTQVITQNVSACVGLENLSHSDLMALIYPNPNNGIFNIELNEFAQVSITNTFGQIVLNKFMPSGKQSIDMQNQANGIYFINILSQGKSQSIKFIKNN